MMYVPKIQKLPTYYVDRIVSNYSYYGIGCSKVLGAYPIFKIGHALCAKVFQTIRRFENKRTEPQKIEFRPKGNDHLRIEIKLGGF